MNTSQLQCCINSIPILRKSILGVFAADQLPPNLHFPCGFIANTDDHLNQGQHWCSFFFPNSTTVEYFDSYGKPIEYFNSYFLEYTSTFTHIVVNSKQLQSTYSDVCGMYCLFFLLQGLSGLTCYDIIHRFSNAHTNNDCLVYNFIRSVFIDCLPTASDNNQLCKPFKNVYR